jgi:hypothetical protein
VVEVVAEAVVAAAGRVWEVAVECRPRPAVRRPWAVDTRRDPRLALPRARAAQRARARAPVARDREPALAAQDRESAWAHLAQMSEPALGRRPAN